MKLPKNNHVQNHFLSFLRLLAVVLLGVSSLFLSGIFSPVSHAFTMSNLLYILEFGNLNSGAGIATGGTRKLISTIGETGAGQFIGTNYQLCAGFYGGVENCQTATQAITFTFSISQTLIDFGTLEPNNPVSRTNTLSINTNSIYGYSISAIEDHSLSIPNSSTLIPDTTCDNGQCTNSLASLWVNALTYGFGFRCDNVVGTDCASDFSSANTFRPFASTKNNQTPQILASGTSGQKTSQVTYKVNISGTQAPGLYSNNISFIATPTF